MKTIGLKIRWMDHFAMEDMLRKLHSSQNIIQMWIFKNGNVLSIEINMEKRQTHKTYRNLRIVERKIRKTDIVLKVEVHIF